MLAIGSLSGAAYSLRQLLLDNIPDLSNEIHRIKIGHPGTNLKELEDAKENGLNLFFYHVDYDGYPADGSPENPFYVRLYCLITAVGFETKETDPDNTEGRTVSRGENELRLVGEVMRVLHQAPVFPLLDDSDNELATLQVVPHSIPMDTLNHIWGTQGSETPYRLSMGYEMSLAPIPYALSVSSSPMVGDPKMLSWGDMHRKKDDERKGLIDLSPSVGYLEIDTDAEVWAPHVVLVETVDPSTQALHYVFRIDPPFTQMLEVMLAGEEGADLRLFWNIWRRKDDNSIVAWQEEIADTETPQKTIADDLSGDPFFPNRIDPNDIDDRRIAQVRLPMDIALTDTKTWQAVLYVERDWRHEEPAGSGVQVITKVRSNTLLLYGEAT